MSRLRLARNEKKENRHHEQAGERNADRDQNAELREPGGAAQQQREKSDRRGQRAEENRAPEVCNRFGNGALV